MTVTDVECTGIEVHGSTLQLENERKKLYSDENGKTSFFLLLAVKKKGYPTKKEEINENREHV